MPVPIWFAAGLAAIVGGGQLNGDRRRSIVAVRYTSFDSRCDKVMDCGQALPEVVRPVALSDQWPHGKDNRDNSIDEVRR
jgi:hypothetical protein